MRSKDTNSATGSQELGAGHLPCDLPAGTQLVLFGPRPAPASPSAAQERERARKTSDISGRHSFPSSASVALTASLANRLQARMDTAGSMEYELTSKRKATPSGLRIFRLRAVGHPISGSGCSGWPSPAGQCDSKGACNASVNRREGSEAHAGTTLTDAAQLSWWASPTGNPGRNETSGRKPDSQHHSGQMLEDQVYGMELTGWPSPNAVEFGCVDVERMEARREECRERTGNGNGFGMTLGQAVASLTGWGTPSARDHKDGRASEETMERNSRPLNEQVVQLAGWLSPTVEDAGRNGSPEWAERWAKGETIPEHQQRLRTQSLLGATSESSPAGTANPAASVLNPAMSRWLMGFPQSGEIPGWDTCSPGWKEWATIQRLLAEYSGTPNATESGG